MKKFLMVLIAAMVIGISANAQNQWNVVLATEYTYEYFSVDDNSFQFAEVIGSSSPTFKVTANSEYEAKTKANQECNKLCRAKEPLGIKTKDGKKYKVFKITHATVSMVWKDEER